MIGRCVRGGGEGSAGCAYLWDDKGHMTALHGMASARSGRPSGGLSEGECWQTESFPGRLRVAKPYEELLSGGPGAGKPRERQEEH